MLPFSVRHPKVFYQGLQGNLQQALTPKLLGMMTEFTLKSKLAKALPWKKSASCTAGFPVEFLLTYDLFPHYSESYCCFAGSAGVTQRPIEYAEGMGFSRDLCSYMKAGIGAAELNYPCDYGGCPTPDVYLAMNAVCDTHVKWFENEARRHGAGFFALDTPSVVCGADDRIAAYIDYVVAQFYDLFEYLTQITGKPFDQKKFMGIVKDSQEACRLYREIYAYRKRFPSAHYFQFQRLFMLPVAVMWNLPGCIKYYRRVLKELQEKYGDPATDALDQREKFRLGWEGITLWYKVDLYHDLLKRGAGFVYETYTDALALRQRETTTFEETLKQMAYELLIGPYTLNLERRIAHWEEKIDEFSLDGLVLHANMSCRPSATALQDLKAALQKSKGIPVLILHADMADPRAYAEGPNQTRFDSFLEILEANRTTPLN